jgi:uncharacterized protein (UPF0212 family)
MGKMLSQPHRLPATREEARKQMITLHGLDYVRIHACINDCVLFQGELADLSKCPKCGEARYQRDVSSPVVPRNVSLKLTLFFTIWVDQCRELAARVPQICRKFAANLPQLCRQFAATLPPICRGFAAGLWQICC